MLYVEGMMGNIRVIIKLIDSLCRSLQYWKNILTWDGLRGFKKNFGQLIPTLTDNERLNFFLIFSSRLHFLL